MSRVKSADENRLYKLRVSELETRVICPICKYYNSASPKYDTCICRNCFSTIKNNSKAHFKYKLRNILQNK